MANMLGRLNAREIGWFQILHKNCQQGHNCIGPGCVRRTGKTARKNGK